MADHPRAELQQRCRHCLGRWPSQGGYDSPTTEILGKLPDPRHGAPGRPLTVPGRRGALARVLGKPRNDGLAELIRADMTHVHPSTKVCRRSHVIDCRRHGRACRDSLGGKAFQIGSDATTRSDTVQRVLQLDVLHGDLLSSPTWRPLEVPYIYAQSTAVFGVFPWPWQGVLSVYGVWWTRHNC